MRSLIKPNSVALPVALLIYCGASLLHYVHNAVYIDAYPNMPGWISVADVAWSWLGLSVLGLAGYLLFSYGRRYTGLALLTVYGALGLDGLAHYTLAPVSAHRLDMNLTIWFEVIAAMAVLGVVAKLAYSPGPRHPL